MAFFQETRHAFGRTALLLSGGATNGIYHLGVIRALKRVHLLPPIVSGASAGSIVAALLGCKTDEELEPILNDGKFDTRFFRVIDPRLQPGGGSSPLAEARESGSPSSSLAASGSVVDAFQWLWDAATMYNEQRAVFETDFLADTLQRELGDLTFREAFQRTGRIINIPVAPQRQGDFPRLLNYLTAPHVVVWSASVASCAIPGVFKPVELVAKDDHGTLRPYHSAGHRWTDGSIELDLPMQRLAELFNVNMFVVSQVNPHAALLALEGPTGRSAPLPLLLRFLKRQGRSFLTSMAELGHGFGLPSITGRGVLPFLTQAYEGDLTLMPDLGLQDFAKLLENPSQDRVKEAIAVGQRMTWPHIPWLRVHCLVEATLDACLRRLRGRLAALVLTGDAPAQLPPATTHSALVRSAGPFASAAAFGHGLMSGTSSPELHELAGAEAGPRGLERHAPGRRIGGIGADAIATATATAVVLSLPPRQQAQSAPDGERQPEVLTPCPQEHQAASPLSSHRSASDKAMLAASSSLASLTAHFGFDSPTDTAATLGRARSAPQESVPRGDQHSPGNLASPRGGAGGRAGAGAGGRGRAGHSPGGGRGRAGHSPGGGRHAAAASASSLGLPRGWKKRGSEARLALLHEMEEDGVSEGARSGSAWSDSAHAPPRALPARGNGTGPGWPVRRFPGAEPTPAGAAAGAPGGVGTLSASSLRAVGLALPSQSASGGLSAKAEHRAPLVDWSSGHLQSTGAPTNGTGTDSRSSRFALEPLQEGDSSEG
jgi:predicted acylesterase/phospholipase RssA